MAVPSRGENMRLLSQQKSTWITLLNPHATAGFLGGLCSTAAFYPLDLLRVHLQRHYDALTRPSIREQFLRAVREEGMRSALYRGFSVSVVGASLAWGQYFYGYSTFKAANVFNLSPAANHLVSGFAAGSLVQIVLCPLWVTKLNVQLAVYPGGVSRCVRELYRDRGIKGFYRGLAPSLWGSVQGGIQFMIYEPTKSKLKSYRDCEQLSPSDIVMATTISKSAAMIIVNPITVLTVRMRDAGFRTHNYDDLWNSVKSTLAKDGITGFYRGVLVSLVRVMPAQWCTFVTYEYVKDAILRCQADITGVTAGLETHILRTKLLLTQQVVGGIVQKSVRQLRALRERRLPFVMRGIGAKWAIVRTWSNDKKLKSLARKEERECPERKYTVYAPDPAGDVNQSDAMPVAKMSISKFLEVGNRRGQYLLGVPDKHGRGLSPFEPCSRTDVSRGHGSEGKVYNPVFAADMDKSGDTSVFEDLFGQGCIDSRRHLFFNAAYCFTNCHYDTDWNCYLCARGNRRWSLAHPDQDPILSHNGSARSQYQPTHRRNAEAVTDVTSGTRTWNRYADLVKFVVVDLNPGDVLIVPPRWWHVVEGSLPADGRPRFSAGINWFFTYDYEETYRTCPTDIKNMIGLPSDDKSVYLGSAVEMMKGSLPSQRAAELMEIARHMADTMSVPLLQCRVLDQLLAIAVGYVAARREHVEPQGVEDALRRLVEAAVDSFHIDRLYRICRFCANRVRLNKRQVRANPPTQAGRVLSKQFLGIDFEGELTDIRLPKVLCSSCRRRLTHLRDNHMSPAKWEERRKLYGKDAAWFGAPIGASDGSEHVEAIICSADQRCKVCRIYSNPKSNGFLKKGWPKPGRPPVRSMGGDCRVGEETANVDMSKPIAAGETRKRKRQSIDDGAPPTPKWLPFCSTTKIIQNPYLRRVDLAKFRARLDEEVRSRAERKRLREKEKEQAVREKELTELMHCSFQPMKAADFRNSTKSYTSSMNQSSSAGCHSGGNSALPDVLCDERRGPLRSDMLKEAVKEFLQSEEGKTSLEQHLEAYRRINPLADESVLVEEAEHDLITQFEKEFDQSILESISPFEAEESAIAMDGQTPYDDETSVSMWLE
ncbi:hypothetical protein FOL47_009061 [Perkinsus chesapeaki]|uniref:JmjC domain-containing protein n=1 Tax=Perkinsus chesapeaki TaxID=330153 RepID=A0A7J6MSH3_PERCH|nr:hypothetical protein FOL47_009061 [Perkinsus chesapeaki]